MLPKNRRIKRGEFKDLLGGVRYNSTHFLVYIKTIEKTKLSLFSFSISKKVCSKAVSRNRLRRQGYSVINKNIKNIKNGFMCFFLFKKGQYPMSFNVLEKEILEVLDKNKIIN